MPKNSAAQEKTVGAAVRLLQTTTGVRVPQAMILAGVSKADCANEIMRQMVQRRYKQLQFNAPVIINDVVVGDKPSLSDLTNNNDVQLHDCRHTGDGPKLWSVSNCHPKKPTTNN